MRFQSFLASFQIGTATGWDIFIIFIALIAIFIYGFVLGKNRMILILLSSYFSLTIMKFLPWERLAAINWLGIGSSPAPSLKMLIFLSLILFFFIFIPRSILSSVLRIRKRGEASWVQLLILGILQVGLLISIILSFLPNQVTSEITPLINRIFLSAGAQFIWITLPLLVITLMKKQKKQED